MHEAGCLGCIGIGQAPATGINSLRTFPRNYKDRSGTKNDAVYLCSPETAAASALTGRITDPRTLGDAPVVRYPRGTPSTPIGFSLVFDTFIIRLGFYPASPNDSYLQSFIIDGVPRAKILPISSLTGRHW